jgi:ketosteroid isomerase-like protein
LYAGYRAGDTAVTVPESNLEIVRKLTDAANRGALDEVGSFYSADIVLDNREHNSIDAGTYIGREQVLTFLRGWMDTFDSRIAAELEETLERRDRAVACFRFHAQVHGSDMEVELRRWWAYAFREGKVVRIEIYANRDEAIAAAGIGQT